ncbi:MAG: PEP/pyruvate-binding domain-containing protein [Chloroflexota bacterium]
MALYCVRLHETLAKDMALVGQKGGNLSQMWSAGLPVPLGFCVTVDAYQAHIDQADLWPAIQAHLNQVQSEDLAQIEVASRAIAALVLQAAMPDAIRESITAVTQELVEELGDPQTPLSVRSSSVLKGHPPASFGGQHEAFLNVIGLTSLLESIQQCWASLWTPRAILYRFQNGLNQADARMAVVVHELVSANVSGTVFTANPITGEADEVIIDAVWGLSEAIVSEMVAPDNFVVRKSDLAVVDRWVSTKRARLMPLADGGTEIQKVPREQQSQPSLTDDEIQTLVRLCLRVEDLFEEPVDIEFAWYHHHLYLLQSRPIAALFGVPTPSLEEELAHRLGRIPLLSGLDREQLLQIARWARLQYIPADTPIIQQGQPGTDFYILASGRVTVRVEIAAGIRRFLGYRGSGYFFGETALLTGERRNATITAVGPVEVFVFDRAAFEKLRQLHPRIEEEIRLRMEARLRLTRILTSGR